MNGKRGLPQNTSGPSGGERQHRAIACALLKRPKVQMIKNLTGKVTIIFVTHQMLKRLQMDEVMNMVEHVMRASFVKEKV